MPNHFEDRKAGDVYELRGAPVRLVRQKAAHWGHTWVGEFVGPGFHGTFTLDSSDLAALGWDRLNDHTEG